MGVTQSDERVLIMAPFGQDAVAMAVLLSERNFSAQICEDPSQMVQAIAEGAGALLLTEEALELPRTSDLLDLLKVQLPWSELPVILLTSGGESRVGKLLDLAASAAGSVTLLERPMSAATLWRSVEVALRARRRQYQVRDLLAQQQRHQETLQTQAHQQKALYRLTDSLTRAVSLDQVYQSGLDSILDSLHGDRAALLLFDDTGVMRIEAWRGLSEQCRQALESHPLLNGKEALRQAIGIDCLKTGQLGASPGSVFQQEGIAAMAFVPLLSQDRLLGRLGVFSHRADAFSSEALELALSIATQLAFGIERKRAEEAQRRSEERFRAIFDHAGVSIWEEDFSAVKLALDALRAEGVSDIRRYCHSHPEFVSHAISFVKIRDVNQATLRLFGAADKAELLQSLQKIFVAETRSVFVEELAAMAERKHFFETETVLQALNGESLNVLFNITFPSGNQSYDRVLITLTDITARKRMEDALRESEARFRNMADHSPVLLWVTDPGGSCTYLNQRWYEYTGQTPENGLGFGWLQAVHPSDQEPSEKRFFAATEKREAFRLEYRLRRRDGEYRWAMDAASPRFSADGEFLGYIGSVVDINDQKRAAETLERMVAEHTAELRETNEQLEAFVYSIAHDLRAPLRAMSGYSQLLIEDYGQGLDESAQRLLKRIQLSSEFMDKLLVDLLAFGRMARAEVELSPVPVQAAWESALAQCASQIEQTQARIEVAPSLPMVRAHEATLTQCLANLLSNALKFVAPGVQPAVRFWAEDAGPKVRLYLRDNGIGIPADQQERVFRVFERIHGGRYPGTGIGLSIVRKGVQRMDGEVRVESEPGQGSRFLIELPQACGAEGAAVADVAENGCEKKFGKWGQILQTPTVG